MQRYKSDLCGQQRLRRDQLGDDEKVKCSDNERGYEGAGNLSSFYGVFEPDEASELPLFPLNHELVGLNNRQKRPCMVRSCS